MTYPSLEEVAAASAEQVVRWLRFLPSPTDEQRPVMDRLTDRRDEMTSEAWTAASKAVGW